MNDHVPKPVDPDVLIGALKHWLPPREGLKASVEVQQMVRDSDGTENRLREIPGLNVVAGLKAVFGKVSSYLRILKVFAHGHGDDVSRLREQMERQAISEAEHTAHALKGAAGTLGATAVYELAAELEEMLRGGKLDGIQEKITCLDFELQPLIQGILSVDAKPEKISPVSPVFPDRTEDREMIGKLKDLLASDDIAARRYFDDNRNRFESFLGGMMVEKLGQQISNFAYPEALAILEAR